MTWKTYALLILAWAGTLACSVARDAAQDSGGASDACTTCHGDASRSGDALSRAAPATGAHLAHVQKNQVACASCHVVPSSAGHADGVVGVTFGGVAKAGGAQPSFAAGTCSGVYCHGATLGAGGKTTTVSWGGGPLACDACHAAPPPSHAASSTSCNLCHPGTVKPDGTIDVANGLHVDGAVEAGAAHPQGWADPAQHGPAAKRDIASCQGCHGIAFDGGTSGVSCNACHGGAAWAANCTWCHGTRVSTYTSADLGKAAPPLGTMGQTATTDRAVGAHQKHLTGGSIGKPVACAECHVVPADLSHLDGTAEVAFGAAASKGSSPTWNGASCASVYCHGATLAGGTNKTPSWTGGSAQAACGTCHGVPPPSGHHSTHSGRSCGDCHPGYTSSSVDPTTHLNGTKEVGNKITSYDASTHTCTNSCHSSRTW